MSESAQADIARRLRDCQRIATDLKGEKDRLWFELAEANRRIAELENDLAIARKTIQRLKGLT